MTNDNHRENFSYTISILVANFNLQNQKQEEIKTTLNVRKGNPLRQMHNRQIEIDTQYHSLPKD